ncbi:uncharacterized protein LOC111024291 [Momordica charantia]|uniref:Uncharacterized protein LOC111024291 n=1 Tax=Momordica charantia TaxID=3673 RepID=A0A6J1DTM1_MOMCH|nr:uncharacterized protein LOC111024291 [Momordica charantia]
MDPTLLMRAAEEAELRELENKYKAITRKTTDTSDEGKSVQQLPKYFALQRFNPSSSDPKTGAYLRCVQDHEILEYGFLKVSGKSVLSPYSKMESEASESSPKHVHIRYCNNNKYWVRQSPDSFYIVTAAAEKEEDRSKWNCTLFSAFYMHHGSHEVFGLNHVQLGLAVLYRSYDSNDFLNCLSAEDKSIPVDVNNFYYLSEDSFHAFVDWDSLFIFPKHVTFKDVEDSSLIHEIFPQNDGTIRIRNVGSRKFWIRDPNWILALAEGGSKDDPNTLFKLVKVDHNIVALHAHMEVLQAVVSRKIENIEYCINDAKIYGERVWSMAKGDATNKTNAADIVQFTFTFEDKRKNSWTNTLGARFGVSKTFSTGIPTIGNGNISVSFEGGAAYSWGETHKQKMLMSCTSTVTIPPMSKVKMNTVVKRGFCDVPFLYTQIDTLRDGQQISREYEDGLFSGFHSYDF